MWLPPRPSATTPNVRQRMMWSPSRPKSPFLCHIYSICNEKNARKLATTSARKREMICRRITVHWRWAYKSVKHHDSKPYFDLWTLSRCHSSIHRKQIRNEPECPSHGNRNCIGYHLKPLRMYFFGEKMWWMCGRVTHMEMRSLTHVHIVASDHNEHLHDIIFWWRLKTVGRSQHNFDGNWCGERN